MTGRSAILTYHSLDTSGSAISISPGVFRSHIESLVQSGTRVVGLENIQKTPNAVAITFDDGFTSFYANAFPVLARHNMPATVFVISGYCGKQNDWPSQPAEAIPRLPLMTWSQLNEIGRHGIALGAHTVNHPWLTQGSPEECERELRECRQEIEDRTGRACKTFAYPYGDTNDQVVQEAARQFDIGCTTVLDYCSAEDAALALPRLDAYYLQNQFWFKRLGTGLGRYYLGTRRRLRELRQRLS